MDSAALDQAAGRVLRALEGGASAGPEALTLLVRRYAATGRPDLCDAAEAGLTSAIEAPPATPEWLRCIAEAATYSADPRLVQAAACVATALAGRWPTRGVIADAMRSLDAALSAAAAIGGEAVPHTVVRAAVDELERVVGITYEPGEGLAHIVGGTPGDAASLDDHVTAASALLAAHAATGRLPYAMLAEELMQFARARWWNETSGGYRASVESNLRAARVLCRIAALHDDPAYQETAVVSPDADFAEDARRILIATQLPERDAGDADHLDDAVEHALALEEFFRVRPELQ